MNIFASTSILLIYLCSFCTYYIHIYMPILEMMKVNIWCKFAVQQSRKYSRRSFKGAMSVPRVQPGIYRPPSSPWFIGPTWYTEWYMAVSSLKKSSIRDISDRSMNLSVNITRFMLSYLRNVLYTYLSLICLALLHLYTF